MKCEIEIDEKILKGYKPVAYRIPKEGDLYLDAGSLSVHKASGVSFFVELIVEPPKEMKFRLCGYVKNNTVEVGKYYMYNGYLKYNSCGGGYIRNGLEIWEKVDE